MKIVVRRTTKASARTALICQIIYVALYFACFELLPFWVDDFGIIFPAFLFAALTMGQATRAISKYTVLAGPDGLTLKSWRGVMWKLRWEDISSTAPTSTMKGTVISGWDGVQRILPILLTCESTFTKDQNALRLAIEAMGLGSGYGRTASLSTAKPIERPNRRWPLVVGASFLGLSVALYFIMPVSLFHTSQVRGVGERILAFTLLTAFATGIYLCQWALTTKFSKGTSLRVALWNSSLLQLGLRSSLYRQLMKTDKPAYGCYRYPDDFAKLGPEDQEAFDLNWPWGPSAFAVVRELYWSAGGPSFTKGGPICTYKTNGYEDDRKLETRALITVTDGEQTATFDPRYLNLVEEEGTATV